MVRKRKIYFLCLLILALFFKSHFVFAEENKKGFSITPLFQEVTLGQEQKEAAFFLEVENTTDIPAIFRISVLDFGSLDESGGVAFLGASDLERKYGLASWINLERDALVIDPDEKQNIRVAVENKESLSPGGHYAAIYLKMEPDKSSSPENPSAVAFSPSFASLVFARKIGGEVYGLELKGQELQKKFLKNPSETTLRFQNTGNTHVVPRGIVKISDPLGREVLRGIINSGSAIILPETFRTFPVTLKKTAPIIFPGSYKLSVEYRYDGKDDFAASLFRFDFIPLAAILACLIIIGLIVGYAFFRKRRKSEKKENSPVKNA